LRRMSIVLVISLAAALGLLSCSQPYKADKEPPRSITRAYSTSFPFAENPISELDNWSNGMANGLDWGNVETRQGIAYGLQNGAKHFADGTALLRGSWWPDQIVEATVYIRDTNVGDYPEVELRLRSSLSANECTGYEVLWGVAARNPYFAIVKWNGPLGDFEYLYDSSSAGYGAGTKYAVSNGDVVRATVIGNVITAYINGVQLAQVTDSTFASGNPGMGFNYYCGGDCTGPHDGYGFTSFSATDQLAEPTQTDRLN